MCVVILTYKKINRYIGGVHVHQMAWISRQPIHTMSIGFMNVHQLPTFSNTNKIKVKY